MKYLLIILSLLFIAPAEIDAQVVIDKLKRKSLQRKSKKEDQAIDKGLDEVENLFKKKNKKKKKKDKDTDKDENESGNDNSNSNTNSTTNTNDGVSNTKDGSEPADDKEAIEMYTSNYDFKPGAKLIFFDDFNDEETGEIPSKWVFRTGMLEVAKATEDHGNAMSGDMNSSPNFKDDYVLPERFTLEYDVFLADKNSVQIGTFLYRIYFRNSAGQELGSLDTRYGSMNWGNITDGSVPGSKKEDFYNEWHHISVSVNGNSVKAYFDQYRLINVRLKSNDKIASFDLYNCCLPKDKPHVFLVDNFRVNEGAHEKYKESIVDGKIVTNNIFFEVNSASLLPRSYAEIKRIANIMQDQESLRFSVEGHTDSDGTDEHNLKLSQDRAASVLKALTTMGIDEGRLESAGHGESKPIDSNDSSEGKAINRRVEFIVI